MWRRSLTDIFMCNNDCYSFHLGECAALLKGKKSYLKIFVPKNVYLVLYMNVVFFSNDARRFISYKSYILPGWMTHKLLRLDLTLSYVYKVFSKTIFFYIMHTSKSQNEPNEMWGFFAVTTDTFLTKQKVLMNGKWCCFTLLNCFSLPMRSLHFVCGHSRTFSNGPRQESNPFAPPDPNFTINELHDEVNFGTPLREKIVFSFEINARDCFSINGDSINGKQTTC